MGGSNKSGDLEEFLEEEWRGTVIRDPRVEKKKHYYLFKTSVADLLKYFVSFSNDSSLFLTLLLNKDIDDPWKG